METKKKNNKFKYIFYSLVIAFISVYVSGKTGYYENKLKKNTLLTHDAIMQFEKDLEEGKPVDIKDYIKADVPDYRNVYSKAGDKISNTIDTIINDGVGKLIDFLKALFS